jgi:hypothetical protein
VCLKAFDVDSSMEEGCSDQEKNGIVHEKRDTVGILMDIIRIL